MAQVNLKEAYIRYLNSLNSGCDDEIEKEKYNLLFEASDLFEVIVNYVVLYKFGLKYDFGKSIIPRGTKLYRIRCYEDNTDFSNPNQWKAPPHKPQNRANIKGQEALYLGSTETICLLEAHIKKDDIYALGIYEATENIEVGGFLAYHSNNKFYNLSGMILNAFLIAPSRSLRNGALELPMKFGVLNQLDKYYDLTNQLCNILSEDTPNGIRYSSCYLPMQTMGIECSDFNIVLYSEGISKVKLVDHKIKTNINDFDYTDLLKFILNG